MAYVMVSGSRSWTDKEKIRATFEEFSKWYLSQREDSTTLVYGCAAGADTLAAEVAEELGWELDPHPARWEMYGKRAGVLRNLEMLSHDLLHVFIFWDGESKGTKHVIDEAKRRHLSYTLTVKE